MGRVRGANWLRFFKSPCGGDEGRDGAFDAAGRTIGFVCSNRFAGRARDAIARPTPLVGNRAGLDAVAPADLGGSGSEIGFVFSNRFAGRERARSAIVAAGRSRMNMVVSFCSPKREAARRTGCAGRLIRCFALYLQYIGVVKRNGPLETMGRDGEWQDRRKSGLGFILVGCDPEPGRVGNPPHEQTVIFD